MKIALGQFKRTPTGGVRVHNNHLIVQADTIRAVYTKLHLYDAFNTQESAKVEPGTAVPALVDIDGFQFGLMTCGFRRLRATPCAA